MLHTKTKMPLYEVSGDAETGSWLGAPEFTGKWVDKAEWFRETDTDEYHCDTYEVEIDDETETRAIRVVWLEED